MKQHSGNGAGRKPGEWKAEVQMRLRKERELINGSGVSNVPSLKDIGSAAYRRYKALHPRQMAEREDSYFTQLPRYKASHPSPNGRARR